MNSITVIIPVYNGERYLAPAIDSVLAQTWLPAEIIVVDDGSTDNSAVIAQSYAPRVCYLSQINLGPAAARNRGVRQATGDLLAFLDADDLWLPDKLHSQLAVLADQPQLDAVLGKVENFISPELTDDQRQLLAKSARQIGYCHSGTLLIYRATFLRIGWFDPRWRHGEFIEWWARAARLNLIYAILPNLVLRRRLHAHNLTRREQDGRQEYLPMLHQHLAHRRALSAQADNPAKEEI